MKEQITQTIGWYGCGGVKELFSLRGLFFFFFTMNIPQPKVQEIKQINQASYVPCKWIAEKFDSATRIEDLQE